MIRSVYCIYEVLCQCVPRHWTVKPDLVWYWDGAAVVRQEGWRFDPDEGFSENEFWAVFIDRDPPSIVATAKLSWQQVHKIVFTLLHELAHANGHDTEAEADDAAFEIFKALNRRAPFKRLGIKLGVRRDVPRSTPPSDRVWSKPCRLPDYLAPWESDERYF